MGQNRFLLIWLYGKAWNEFLFGIQDQDRICLKIETSFLSYLFFQYELFSDTFEEFQRICRQVYMIHTLQKGRTFEYVLQRHGSHFFIENSDRQCK